MPFYCVTCEGTDTNSPPSHIYIYQSRQRGDVDIPRSIINKTWNPKHIRHSSPFYIARSFFFFYISSVPRRCVPLHPSMYYPSSATTREKLYRQPFDSRIDGILYFLLLPARFLVPVFRARSRFRFDSLRPRIAILGRAIYSVEHRHGFELIGERGSPARFLLSFLLDIRVTSSSGNEALLRAEIRTYLFLRKKLRSTSVSSLLWLSLHAQNILTYISIIPKIWIF